MLKMYLLDKRQEDYFYVFLYKFIRLILIHVFLLIKSIIKFILFSHLISLIKCKL